MDHLKSMLWKSNQIVTIRPVDVIYRMDIFELINWFRKSLLAYCTLESWRPQALGKSFWQKCSASLVSLSDWPCSYPREQHERKEQLMTNPVYSCIFHIVVVNYNENSNLLTTCRCADLRDHYLLGKVLGMSQSRMTLAELYYYYIILLYYC